MAKIFGFEPEDCWHHENGFYLTSDPSRIGKLLAHYELYKSITGLPGHIVELGVYKGASLIRFATFRQVLENSNSRKIIGFDAFGKFPRHGDQRDHAFIQDFEQVGGDGIDVPAMEAVLRLKRFENVELIAGDILQTVPRFAADRPEAKIALLHIDVDVYEPCVVAMKHLWERLVVGGLLVLDDYGTVAGETRAIDEFFASLRPKIEKLSLSHIPAFIRKA